MVNNITARLTDNARQLTGKFIALISLLLFVSLVIGCEKTDERSLVADFNYEYIDSNHVKFINESEGEYYALFWDFGNGDTLSTTNKRENLEVFYPRAGDYDVQLVLYNYTGQSQSVIKPITIDKDDLVVSFSAEIDAEDQNYVLLEDRSVGNFDSIQWVYRKFRVTNAAEHRAYFPFKGQFKIELVVFRGTSEFTSEKTITILQDDDNYVDKLLLTWSDEFSGTAVDMDNWSFETGAGGWGNNELQNYTNGENADVVDGTLIITARKVNEEKLPGSYTSSRMITMNKREFAYGRMEIRAKLPSGTGIWPAIWMLGSNFKSVGWPACGEIDIMEYVGYQPNRVHATLHTPSSYGNSVNGTSIPLETCEEEFHAYGIIWNEKQIRFYIDSPDNITYSYAPAIKNAENWPFDQPFFFILNIAVGGNWGGAHGIDNTIFPQTMEIDYVRVYQELP